MYKYISNIYIYSNINHIYIIIYTHIHTHIDTHIHTYTHTYVRTYVHTYISLHHITLQYIAYMYVYCILMGMYIYIYTLVNYSLNPDHHSSEVIHKPPPVTLLP